MQANTVQKGFQPVRIFHSFSLIEICLFFPDKRKQKIRGITRTPTRVRTAGERERTAASHGLPGCVRGGAGSDAFLHLLKIKYSLSSLMWSYKRSGGWEERGEVDGERGEVLLRHLFRKVDIFRNRHIKG